MAHRQAKLHLIAPSAAPAQAAAIVAALERFMRDTAPPATAAVTEGDRWTEMARLEAVREPGVSGLDWGHPSPWA